ncbi:MAG: LysM peptidoglycan-binding domain-containing protein [Butyrivibrio sp.]|nr:LysM peptidoglycan-binding domain-containing protein [Muribaculum sp.]MCM1551633.1 LysM peptidoglycan-binding domain-containing protein [Butyrivibrio sp.]
MRENKRICEMTDRELREYKRMIRRRRERRGRVLSLVMAMMAMWAILICVVSYHSLTSNAKNDEEDIMFKYYTSVTVEAGDSLWSVADRYVDYQQYKDKDSYIEEVCSINNLADAAGIRAGQRLVVPYYSAEFVK